ncbi:YbaK/EbsC family protein [Clostridium hydrogenum]|uniref:YbaK/EbsC family protein n=1 Tax=Clostridium hydrogenum TaxID=2855764 RepID=UPI001F3ECF31|nr:YbaK/EbsC family protein [Clostridium hydrogenum]
MSVESVKKFFIENGLKDPVFELNENGATVDLAAKTLGVNPEFIAKTLAFKLKDNTPFLIVTRGNAKIDNKKYKEFFKTKAKMLEHDEVEEITGHPVGGVCPFGLKTSMNIYLDISLKNFEYVYPAAGSQTTALKISPNDIENLTNAIWIDVCKF